jgi:phosphoglycerate dehydrogenase-like enzyme
VLAWDYDPAPLMRLLGTPRPPRWVHTRAAGVDPSLAALAARAGTVLTTGSGAHGAAVAEHVVALVLAHLRRIPDLVRAQQARQWPGDFPVSELRGRLAGLIGAGDLGRCTARLLQAFGARVRGLRRVAAPVPEMPEMHGADALPEFLAGLEVLVIAAPLTPETRGMIGPAELGRLAPGCLLVNVGRGPIVEEAALVAALQSGHLGGAALDVFDTEPLPPSSPLWSLPNVLVSPHCADLTAQTAERCLSQYLNQVSAFRRGAALRAVDPALGY